MSRALVARGAVLVARGAVESPGTMLNGAPPTGRNPSRLSGQAWGHLVTPTALLAGQTRRTSPLMAR
jgi:hypothetical protein